MGFMAGKHTPGPWETGAVMTNVEFTPKGHRFPMRVADCHPSYNAPESEEERLANARLIAAAPELLESMTFIRDACFRILDGKLTKEQLAEEIDDIQRHAEESIAKARGDNA